MRGTGRAEFQRGMQELGYTEGKQYASEERHAEGKNERLMELAAELVRLNVDVIIATATNAAIAAQKATATIPIVFVSVSDPIAARFADSLARPGRNMTGLTNFIVDLTPKRLELLKLEIPNLSRVALLVNPGNPNYGTLVPRMRSAADTIGMQVTVVDWNAVDDINTVFTKITREGAQAVVISGDTYHFDQRNQICDAAIKYKIASISPVREYTEAGGLMSYGTNVPALYRRAATYVVKILKGAKPADLPIEQPTDFELVVNLKTAKAIGITILPSVLLRADEVIQ